jgi:hypothetical protein
MKPYYIPHSLDDDAWDIFQHNTDKSHKHARKITARPTNLHLEDLL